MRNIFQNFPEQPLAVFSMGGSIAGRFAVEHPEKVLSLALVAPGGVLSAEKSEFARLLEKGDNRLIINTPEDFQKLLESEIEKIRMPLFILWGDTDRILHVSGADILAKKVPGSKVVIMINCGHIPMVERPGESARHYLEFLKSLK